MAKKSEITIGGQLRGVTATLSVGDLSVQEENEKLVAEGAGSIAIFAFFTPDDHFVVKSKREQDGEVISATTTAFSAVLKVLGQDWSLVHQLTPRQFEELIAAAYKEEGWDKVVLTPPSGDLGRDVIVEKKGFGALKIVNSAKRFQANGIVSYDDIRALVGVMAMETSISKGVISTSGRFPPDVMKDKLLKPLIPTRLELLDGKEMQKWMKRIEDKKKA